MQRGILHFEPNEYYIIHPLPKRFHDGTSKQPHVVIRKHHKKTCPYHHNTIMLPTNRDEIKITKEIKAKAEGDINLISLNRSKRETFPLGTPIFVETAVFVDKDLFEHMKTNFPVDTERELIRFVLAMINAVSSGRNGCTTCFITECHRYNYFIMIPA
jgi:hypothetical protein